MQLQGCVSVWGCVCVCMVMVLANIVPAFKPSPEHLSLAERLVPLALMQTQQRELRHLCTHCMAHYRRIISVIIAHVCVHEYSDLD